MVDITASFDEKFNIIKTNYIKSLNDKFILLTGLTNSVNCRENADDENSIEAVNEIYQNIHKLSGSSAIFGFPKISELSNKTELSLKEFIDGGYLSDKQAVCREIESLLNEIKNTLQKEV